MSESTTSTGKPEITPHELAGRLNTVFRKIVASAENSSSPEHKSAKAVVHSKDGVVTIELPAQKLYAFCPPLYEKLMQPAYERAKNDPNDDTPHLPKYITLVNEPFEQAIGVENNRLVLNIHDIRNADSMAYLIGIIGDECLHDISEDLLDRFRRVKPHEHPTPQEQKTHASLAKSSQRGGFMFK